MCGPRIDVNFTNPYQAYPWTQGLTDDALQALNRWEDLKTLNGGPKVHIRQDPAPWGGQDYDTVEIFFDPTLPDSGLAVCGTGGGGAYIRLNTDFYDGTLSHFRDTVRHELGHILDLVHTGHCDSYGGTDPNPCSTGPGQGVEIVSMATCVGSLDRVLGQDDAGAIWNHVGGDPSEMLPLTANPGFEDDDAAPTYWGLSGASWSIETSGAMDGDNYLVWQPSQSGQNLYQTMNVSFSEEPIDIKLGVRKSSLAAEGTINVGIWRKRVRYSAGPTLCGYPGDLDMRSRAYVDSLWVFVSGSSATWTPTTSWQTFDSPNVVINLENGLYDAWDVRMRIFSDVTILGVYVPLAFDNVRIRGESWPNTECHPIDSHYAQPPGC